MHLRENIRALKTTQAMGRVFGDGKRLLYNSVFKIFFNSVQLLSRVQLSATPWTAPRQASLSITNSQSLLKLMFIESVMPSSHLILCHPLLLPPSIFPSIRVFSNESALHIRWPKYWSSHYEFLLWIPTVTFLTERKFRGDSLPTWLSGQESACQGRRCRRRGFNLWVGKIPWKRAWQPAPVFLCGEPHGQRSLVGHSPWDHEELDTAEWLSIRVHTQTMDTLAVNISPFSHLLQIFLLFT